MMLRKMLSFISKDHRGFTLIEVMLVLALTGVIGNAIIMTITTTIDTIGRSSNEVDTIAQARNAELWIQKDGKMAQTISLGSPSSTGLPLTLTWYDWDSNEHQASYEIINNNLTRNYEMRNPNGAVTDSQTKVIAKHIVSGSPQTTCKIAGAGVKEGEIIFTVTIREGEGEQKGIATRSFEVKPRPRE